MHRVIRGMGLRSVRMRLMLWNVGIVALVLGAMGGLISYTVRAKLMASVETDLRDRARRIPPPRPMDRQNDDPGPMDPRPPIPRDPDGGVPVNSPRVFGLDGKGLAPFEDRTPWDFAAFTAAAAGTEVMKTILIDGDPARLLSVPQYEPRGRIPPPGVRVPRIGSENEPPGPGERPVGVIQAVYPLTEVNRSIEEMDRTLLTLIPVALALAGAGGAWLTDRALRPVRRITQTAARIGADDLRQRLPLTGSDEFAELAATINGMLERLQFAFGRMESLVEKQRRFTADASHELKTPLTIIKANSSLALATNPDRDGYQEAVEEIDRAANSMNRLVQDLLLLARADEARAGLDREVIVIDVLLRDVAESARRPGCVRIECATASTPVAVCANREELQRVLTNLVENALRHTPTEGTVALSCRAEAGDVCVLVADTGSGILPEHLPHLFERFYRADTSRARVDGGAGLGLAICKSLVEANGGQLRISSEPGVGTTVTITLPAEDHMRT